VAVVALLQPAANLRLRQALAPLAALATVVLVASAVNYRWDDTFRHRSPRWSDQVAKAAVECRAAGTRDVQIRSGPAPYYSLVMVPCHNLDRLNWCDPAYCRQVGLPPVHLQQAVRESPVG
jgi:hypothetical protein